MTPAEAARLLAKLAAYDRRTVGTADAAAWAEALADIDLPDAMAAVPMHYRATSNFAMPDHIIAGVRMIRDERRRRTPHESRELPSRFETDEDRALRIKRGAALCREVLNQRPSEEKPADANDPIRDRALRRARSERRGVTA